MIRELFEASQKDSGLQTIDIVAKRIQLSDLPSSTQEGEPQAPSTQKPYTMTLKRSGNDWRLTLDCEIEYTSPHVNDGKTSIAKARWHCEALIPNTPPDDQTTMELHFTATPIEDTSSAT